jgi:hypothetical protein
MKKVIKLFYFGWISLTITDYQSSQTKYSSFIGDKKVY